MQKVSIVCLTKQERVELRSVVNTLTGTGQQGRRAPRLLKADADGPNGIAARIAEVYVWRTRTVARLRQRCVEHGCDAALHRVERTPPPGEKLRPGEPEARSSATRVGPPPQGAHKKPLRWLARKVVAWASVASVSYDTVRRPRKKMA